MKQMMGLGAALAIVCCIAVPAMGAGYVEAVSWATINSPAPGTSTQHYGWVIDGTTVYHQLGTSTNSRITKVDSYDTVPAATELVSQGAWSAASGNTSMLTFNGFGLSGDNLQFGDTGSDAIWRANKNTGAIATYVDKASIQAHTGFSGVGLLSPSWTLASGEQVFYEGSSDSILVTTGPNSVSTLITDVALTALMGTDSVSGGIGEAPGGDLYFATNSTTAGEGMYKRDSGGTLSAVLSEAEIIAVTGQTDTGFGDVYGMADGDIIFYDTRADSILRFDPADPANTLITVINEADLLAGPGAGDVVYELGEIAGQVAFGLNGTRGLYVIPEPATLSILALGGVVLLRRRR